MEVTKTVLSILICTTSARSEVIKPLLNELNNQCAFYGDEIEILINDHETDSVGKKRNDLLNLAKGEWQCAIDSDDMISKDYIGKIMSPLVELDPDCLGISGIITTNGRDQRNWHITKNCRHWHTAKDGTYWRTPNHISPIRTSIAKQVGFKDMGHGEDHDFSIRVLPLIQTEIKIDGILYHYIYKSKK